MFRRKNVFFTVNKQDVKLMIIITILSSLGTQRLLILTVGHHGNDDKTNFQGIVLIKYKHKLKMCAFESIWNQMITNKVLLSICSDPLRLL